MATSQDISARIRRALREERLSVEELAVRTGYGRSQTYNFCNGRVAPNLPALQKIALVLNRPLSYFLPEPLPHGRLAVLLSEAEEWPEEVQEHIAKVVKNILEYEAQRQNANVP